MNSRVSLKSMLSLTLVIALAVLAIGGCSSKSKQTDVPANTTISLTAPSTLNTGSTTVVVAKVLSGGTGLADQVITFTVTPTTAGHFTPETDTTDANGEAASIFTATTSGSVTISARSAVGGLVANSGMSIQQNQQQNGSGNIAIAATPSLLLANGADTASVTITVRDALGQPAPDSTVVRLAAGERFVDKDGNGYWTNGVDSLMYDANGNGHWDALGFIPSTTITSGGNGTATVKYVSGNDAYTVYIKATVNDNNITGYAETPLQLSPNATIASIYLESDSMNLSVKGTGGIETALIHATGYDLNGNPVPEGLPINFIITDGPGGGEHLANVGLGPYSAVTNSQGIAVVSVSSGTKSGTLRIRAYSDTVLSEATQVMISSGPPAHIVVGVEHCNLADWYVVGGTNKITAVVSDVYLNPVNDSTVVYFTTDEGTMKSHEERTQDHDGIAYSTWFSGNNVDSADGRVKVIVETSGNTVNDTSFFWNTAYCSHLAVTGAPAALPADGVTKATVIVTGTDLNGNPVSGGTVVDADATYLKVAGGSLEDGCYGSSVRLQITSATLDMDHSRTGVNDDGIGAVDMVQYWVGATAFVQFPVQLQTGFAYSGKSTINCPTTVDSNQVADITVTIKDRWGNPLADHSLVLTASGGTILGSTGKTDAYGEASGFAWKSPATKGTVILTITDTDPRGGIVLTQNVSVSPL
ncbi:MAG TPA: hypothetical protein VMS71_07995 [Candidatus Acidoferrum sp.]|nr:hypothetical protein [Candidatus Acidoferrum sp.]